MSRMRMMLWRGALMATVSAAVLAIGAQAAGAQQLGAAKKATAWLGESAQLVEGTHYKTYFHNFENPEEIESYEDVGLTIDGNLAFLAANSEAGNFKAQAKATKKWIQEKASSYEGGGSCTGTKSGELYAGPTAKVAVFQDANAVSATGTVKQLECLQATGGAEEGRIEDQSEFGDFSNTFGQSLGIIAFAQAGKSTPLSKAATYLVKQQCTEGTGAGGFRSSMGNTSTNCSAAEVEVDSTAIAVEALSEAGKTTAMEAAVEWLEGASHETEVEGKKQLFWESTACHAGEVPPISEPSVNSTAVSSMAYAIAGEPGVGKAERWIKSQQDKTGESWLNGCADPNAEVLNSNRIRATTQGVLGLLGIDYLELAAGIYAL